MSVYPRYGTVDRLKHISTQLSVSEPVRWWRLLSGTRVAQMRAYYWKPSLARVRTQKAIFSELAHSLEAALLGSPPQRLLLLG